MKSSAFVQLALVLILAFFGAACEQSSKAPRDIRAPLTGGLILMKDLTNETKVPSTELDQTIEAIAQNKDLMMRVIVKKGSPLVSEVERQVSARNLQSRVQLVEQ